MGLCDVFVWSARKIETNNGFLHRILLDGFFFGGTQYPCDPFDMVVLMNKKDVLVIGWSFGRK